MAAILQNVDLAPGVDTALYSSATGYDTTGNIRIVNRNSVTITVSIAIVSAPDESTALADLTVADYIEFNAPVSANDILEDSGIVIPEGHFVIVNSSSNNVNAVLYGFTQSV